MSEQATEWLIDDVPATDDPAVVRAYLRDLRSMSPPSPEVPDLIRSAERLLAELEAEQAQSAA